MTNNKPKNKSLASKLFLAPFVLMLSLYGYSDNTIAATSGPVFQQEAGTISTDDMPPRPKLPLELGEDFLGPGELAEGWNMWTGAVWRPALWVFGNYQTAIQFSRFDINGNSADSINWVNRLDLLANLRLSGTERILFNIRPLDKRRSQFTNYTFESPDGSGEGFNEEVDFYIDTLFFEGDFGEVFPALDSADSTALDIGFSVGRQQITRQNGMLLNDNLDSVGFIKNNLLFQSTNNVSITALAAWNNVHQSGVRDESASLYGLFTNIETVNHTMSFDVVYLNDSDDTNKGIIAGVGTTQRYGGLNTTFRGLTSRDLGEAGSTISNGGLLSSELSITPHGGHNLIYLNLFLSIADYTSAANSAGTSTIGPLGISFAGVGVGGAYGPFGAALPTSTQETFGGAVGYQFLFSGGRKQLILEYAIKENDDALPDGQAATLRFQTAIGAHYIFQWDAFYGKYDNDTSGYGTRGELRVKF